MIAPAPLAHRERVRRVAILCCHTLRNVAFYRAGWHGGRILNAQQFWVNANGGFLDTAVLEWCKLFTDGEGRHHWKRVVVDQVTFRAGLCTAVRMHWRQFRNSAERVTRYRNKFVAHLDDERVMNIPRMRFVRQSAAYLYDHLLDNPATSGFLPDAHPSAAAFYSGMYRGAREQYLKSL